MTATFEQELRDLFDNDADTMRDLATHGASGGFPGLTYYTDTVQMHDKHEDEIWDALNDDSEAEGISIPALIASFGGAENVGSMTQLKNLLTWYMAERVARQITDDAE